MSCVSRLEWFLNSKFSYLLNSYGNAIDELKSLAKLYDDNGLETSPIILENHYLEESSVDVSFMANEEIIYAEPFKAQALFKDAISDFNSNEIHDKFRGPYFLEYDSSPAGYDLSGIFFPFPNKDKCFEEKIRAYESLLKGLGSTDHFNKHVFRELNKIIDDLGDPIYVAIMSRGSKFLKYIIDPSKATVSSLSRFFDDHFKTILESRSVESKKLATVILHHKEDLCIRLSLDYDLTSYCYLPKLGIEFSPKSSKNHLGTNYPWIDFLSVIPDSPVGLSECLALMQCVPYGVKMPSKLNFLCLDYSKFKVQIIRPNHLKLSLANDATEIKSYISITESTNTLPANEFKFF